MVGWGVGAVCSLLNEDDVLHGLWLRRRGSTRETRLGMSLTQHGFWQEAQDVFFQAMTKAQQVGRLHPDPLPSSSLSSLRLRV